MVYGLEFLGEGELFALDLGCGATATLTKYSRPFMSCISTAITYRTMFKNRAGGSVLALECNIKSAQQARKVGLS